MTKTLITVIMEELVIIAIITVKKLTYRRNSMEKKRSKQTNKLELVKKLIRQTRIELSFIIYVTNAKRKEKKLKTRTYNTFHEPLSQVDRWEILFS